MSPPPQLSRSATGGLIGSIFGRNPVSGFPETAPVSSKGGRREIPYLAGAAKFQARGPQFMPGSPVLRWRCGLHATGPSRRLRNGGFGGFSPVGPSATALFAHIPGSRSPGLGKITCPGSANGSNRLLESAPAYRRAQRNITFSEHAASSTSISATCRRSPANLRIGLMM